MIDLQFTIFCEGATPEEEELCEKSIEARKANENFYVSAFGRKYQLVAAALCLEAGRNRYELDFQQASLEKEDINHVKIS